MSNGDRALAFAAALWLAALVGGPAAYGAGPRTVLDGMYTEAQAARGLAAFRANCMRCHADNLLGQGNAPLTGAAMCMERWREEGLDTLFGDRRTRMPNDKPGTLAANTDLDILTYILKSNAFPAGAMELTADTLSDTQLVGKDGPKLLPMNTFAAAVGCLAPGANDSWTLARAAQPVRTRDEAVTTPAEKDLRRQTPGDSVLPFAGLHERQRRF